MTSLAARSSAEDMSKFSQYTRQELERLCYKYSGMIAQQEERMREVNELLASNLAEIRQLKEINRKLNVDNKQLQDLCCFIDNERLEGRKLAKEWQKFGRYSADVVKKEVPQYREKLKQLQILQECLVDAISFVLDLHTNNQSTSSEILQQKSDKESVVSPPDRIQTEPTDMNASISSTETSDAGFWKRDSHKERNCSVASENAATISILPLQTVIHPKDIQLQTPHQPELETESGSSVDLTGATNEFCRNLSTRGARSSLHGRYHRKRYSSKTHQISKSRNFHYTESISPKEEALVIETNRNEDYAGSDDKVISGANIEICQIGNSSGSEDENLSASNHNAGNDERRENTPDLRNHALNSGCLATL